MSPSPDLWKYCQQWQNRLLLVQVVAGESLALYADAGGAANSTVQAAEQMGTPGWAQPIDIRSYVCSHSSHMCAHVAPYISCT